MSEGSLNPEDSSGAVIQEASQGEPESAGSRLRAARENRPMTVDEAALALKLSPRQVQALESGDWEKLPGPTFIRGFIRNYARLVGLPADELLADLGAPAPTRQLDLPQTTSAVLPQPGRVEKRDYAPVLAGVVFVTLAIVTYYVVPQDLWQRLTRDNPPAVVAESSETSKESTPLFPPGGAPGAVPQDGMTSQSLPVQAVVQTASVPTSSEGGGGAAAPVLEASGLVMSFSQPSWVEVRDKSGRIVFSQLNQAGAVREIEGLPPFALVVGNAGHVSVRYKGREVELQPRSKDDVARVTVE